MKFFFYVWLVFFLLFCQRTTFYRWWLDYNRWIMKCQSSIVWVLEDKRCIKNRTESIGKWCSMNNNPLQMNFNLLATSLYCSSSFFLSAFFWICFLFIDSDISKSFALILFRENVQKYLEKFFDFIFFWFLVPTANYNHK